MTILCIVTNVILQSHHDDIHVYCFGGADLCFSASITVWWLAVGSNWCVLRICGYNYQSPDGVYCG